WTQAAAVLVGLLVVRALLGVVSAPLHPTGARLVGNWIPPHGASRANGLVTAAACVGVASTYPVFGWLMDTLDWPGAFLVAGGGTLSRAAAWPPLRKAHPR